MLEPVHLTRLIAVIAVLVCPACAPAADEGYRSAAPAAKLDAITDTARVSDRAAVRRLIEQLDSDDAAVRLAAITALQRLTGETHGYRHYDPPAARAAAVERWVEAVDLEPHAGRDDRDAEPSPDV